MKLKETPLTKKDVEDRRRELLSRFTLEHLDAVDCCCDLCAELDILNSTLRSFSTCYMPEPNSDAE